MTSSTNYDLIVVGCGAAGLAASLTYAEATETLDPPRRIAILERSIKEERGGATRWTDAFLRVTEDRTFDPDYVDHLDRVSGGRTDTAYLRKLEREVPKTLSFIEERGVKLRFDEFPLAHRFDKGVASTTPPGMPEGGGRSIVEALAAKLESFPNVDFRYETEAVRLITDDSGAVSGLVVRGSDGRTRQLTGRSVVLACGGFEGNYEVLTRYIGERACDLPLIAPGVANNRGDGLRMALELGADTAGQFDMIHAEPSDSRTSKPNAVLYSYIAGIFVNQQAERFFDEGIDTWDNTFEKIGYEIWKNQNQKAYWIADAKTLAIPGIEAGFLSDLPPERADSLGELAQKLGLDAEALQETVDTFNAATTDSEFDHTRFDGKRTVGITPAKANWAVPLDTPPFIGYPLTAVITFTFGGVRTDTDARVVLPNGAPIPNLYAAGEVTGLFYHEYPPATSVLRSLTFGRIAGEHAVQQHS
ncbi:FAD-binding protein [Nocardia sp. NPDC052112]|uniref:FAD-binding protein n=1 Tax=Nocardia sp. NPDC052112 TaxID=3155646 RepID=UPI00343933D0